MCGLQSCSLPTSCRAWCLSCSLCHSIFYLLHLSKASCLCFIFLYFLFCYTFLASTTGKTHFQNVVSRFNLDINNTNDVHSLHHVTDTKSSYTILHQLINCCVQVRQASSTMMVWKLVHR